MAKTAIVTGASGNGIGRSAALTLARDGFDIIVNYRSKSENAEAVCEEIIKSGRNAVPVKADLFSHEECDRLINEAVFAFGRIDACVIGPGAGWNPEPVEKLNAEKSLNDVIQEVHPLYALVPRLIGEMKKAGGGRIISIASNPDLPSPSYSYNTAKNARTAAMLGLSGPCWKHRITVNVIAPGPVEHLGSFEDAVRQVSRFPADDRNISPQDIAETVSFLCSDKGRFITGNVLRYQF